MSGRESISLNNFFLPEHPNLFTLEGQIQHKVDFIESYVPKGVELLFIGHSIGSKIAVRLVDRFQSSHKTRAYLLFPTIERMAQTPSGRKLWPVLGPLRRPVVWFVSLLNVLPESWLKTMVHWFLSEWHFVMAFRHFNRNQKELRNQSNP